MSDLKSLDCEACRVGASLATAQEIAEFLPQIPNWEIVEIKGVERLRRTYAFSDFKAALVFTNRVGELAEEVGHHPAILTEWGRVTVSWWSHKIKGLNVTDFVMAARTDNIPRS